MTDHPELLLSAYLDGALAPAERTGVASHLEECDRCRARLAELRATSRLLAALPELRPARSLRPRIQQGWLWLRPVRLIGSIGSGAFVFLFLASYVINSGTSLGGGTSTSETLAAQGKFGAAASAAAAENAQKRPVAPTPAPNAAAAPAQSTTSQDASQQGAPPGASGAPVVVATGGVASVREDVRRQVGPPPVTWLAIAFLFALVAFVAHRRLARP